MKLAIILFLALCLLISSLLAKTSLSSLAFYQSPQTYTIEHFLVFAPALLKQKLYAFLESSSSNCLSSNFEITFRLTPFQSMFVNKKKTLLQKKTTNEESRQAVREQVDWTQPGLILRTSTSTFFIIYYKR